MALGKEGKGNVRIIGGGNQEERRDWTLEGEEVGGWLGGCLQKNGCICLQAINQISGELNLLRNATCCNEDFINDMCFEGTEICLL